MWVFLVSILGVWGVWLGSESRKGNKNVKIHVIIARSFDSSYMYLFADASEALTVVWMCKVIIHTTHITSGPYPHTPFRDCFAISFWIMAVFLSLKLNHSITLYCLKSKILNSSHFFFCPFYLCNFPSQYFDPKFSSSLSESLLCSNCLFKSHVSLEISFKISSLSLYSLLISPSAAIYLTL